MARIMSRQEKADLIELFDFVRDAPVETWVGGRNGHMSTTAGFTKGGWRKHFMKNDYVMMDCGIPIEVERPTIDSTVYYDDELDDPMGGGEEAQKRVWMRYNLRYKAPNSPYVDRWTNERIELWKLMLDRPFVYDHKNQGAVGAVVFMDEYSDHQGFYKQELRHYMSESEVEEFGKCLDILTSKYVKRLESYWKRYRDKIRSSGYWANR